MTTRQVHEFAVVTARPRLGTWSIITSRVGGGGKKFCLNFSLNIVLQFCLWTCPLFIYLGLLKVTQDVEESIVEAIIIVVVVGGGVVVIALIVAVAVVIAAAVVA